MKKRRTEAHSGAAGSAGTVQNVVLRPTPELPAVLAQCITTSIQAGMLP